MKRIFFYTICIFMIFLSVSCANSSKTLSSDEPLNLGEKHLVEKDYEQALAQFLKAIETKQADPRSYIGAAEAYTKLGEETKAADILEQGAKILPDSIMIRDALEKMLTSSNTIVESSTEILSDNSETSSLHESVKEPDIAQNQEVSESSSAGENIFPAMSKIEHKALHIFLSNFAEVGMSDFDANNYSDDDLITFAIWHTYKNNPKLISASENNENYSGKISSETISDAVKRYFGIQVKHKSVGYIDNPNYWNYGQYTYLYESGYYYFMAADGDPVTWAQATAMTGNDDGTYTAYFDEYESHLAPDNLYEDIDDWNLNTKYGTIKVYKKGDDNSNADYFEAAVYSGSLVAKIKPYDNNGKATYQLISLRRI